MRPVRPRRRAGGVNRTRGRQEEVEAVAEAEAEAEEAEVGGVSKAVRQAGKRDERAVKRRRG